MPSNVEEERYMKAKFSLTAYLACWLVLKLCKKACEKRLSASNKGLSETTVRKPARETEEENTSEKAKCYNEVPSQLESHKTC
ncbi:hypothetical protein Y1Q_0013240 [Alligator mississippiensis]|uniref:Uncharacterized protein n=1 Tax=Alligator mississippiensis TaxID=8496 RepID=A0A151NVH1_ALLMI|nr:hypothetical protein Y1Q_0013240 [Alligator mississippiensis]